MKSLCAILGLSLFTLMVQAALPQPDLIARIYFAGAQKISTAPNSANFTNEFCCADALALRAQTAVKLSDWLAGWLQVNLNTTVTDGQAKLRPLLNDLQVSEWFLEARTAAGGKPEVALAIKLDPARSQLWQSNLKPFFAAGTFKSTGGWLIFDSDPSLLKLGDHLAQEVSTAPPGWFALDLNWPLLAQWFPTLKELAVPETQLTITAPDDNFRINGKFYFAENLALNLEPWRVPTNTLHQPFNSFTAVRGFASWLQTQPWFQSYQMTPVPNEVFFWSLPTYPFQMFAAVPVPDASSTLAQMYGRLLPVISAADARQDFMASVTMEMSNNDISFIGMPILAPYLRAINEPAGQYLFLEPFPNTPHSKPLPLTLFQRLAMKDLVFYHWEITAERIPQLLQLSQFGLMVTQHKQLDAQAVVLKWLQKVGVTLGNTDTEITQSGPAEFTFTRKAPGIFTAAELFTLANWLEAPNFPGCDLKLPPPSPRLKQIQEKQKQRPKIISMPALGQ